jgi:hypothetical protein
MDLKLLAQELSETADKGESLKVVETSVKHIVELNKSQSDLINSSIFLSTSTNEKRKIGSGGFLASLGTSTLEILMWDAFSFP